MEVISHQNSSIQMPQKINWQMIKDTTNFTAGQILTVKPQITKIRISRPTDDARN